jgi:hypothetical protein
MRINNSYLAPLSVSPAESQPAADLGSRDTAPARPFDGPSTHTLSTELKGLISLAQNQPEVRSEAVAAAKAKLAQGVYATLDSAGQTASAILAAAD